MDFGVTGKKITKNNISGIEETHAQRRAQSKPTSIGLITNIMKIEPLSLHVFVKQGLEDKCNLLLSQKWLAARVRGSESQRGVFLPLFLPSHPAPSPWNPARDPVPVLRSTGEVSKYPHR